MIRIRHTIARLASSRSRPIARPRAKVKLETFVERSRASTSSSRHARVVRGSFARRRARAFDSASHSFVAAASAWRRRTREGWDESARGVVVVVVVE
jgi:hypothetical protein